MPNINVSRLVPYWKRSNYSKTQPEGPWVDSCNFQTFSGEPAVTIFSYVRYMIEETKLRCSYKLQIKKILTVSSSLTS